MDIRSGNIRMILIATMLVIIQELIAQPWMDFLPREKSTKEYTLKDYQKAFYEYWAPYNVRRGKYKDGAGIIRKAIGWKQFKRWEWYMEAQVDPKTGTFLGTGAILEYKKQLNNSKALKAETSSWINIGPKTSGGGYAGIGRINCIAFHPSDINTYWIGAPSGGLWKTTDNGTTWTCLTDNIGVMGVSSIIIPSDYVTSNTIYIGTGDRDFLDNRGIGVLKSIDGGLTWNSTGLSFQLNQGNFVTKMLIDPSNVNHLLVAAKDGIYETFNGATSFNKINSTYFIDIEHRPGSFNRFYCGTKNNGRIALLTYNGAWNISIVKTITNGKRVEIATCPSQPDWVYAVVAHENSGLSGVCKSEDNGITFNEVYSGNTKNLLGWNADGSDADGQGHYDLCIIASPNDANTVFVGGINTWKSTNGGSNWSIVNHWDGNMAQTVHADKHNFAYRADGKLFELNDGGVYLSNDNGNSGSWIDKTNGIAISQIYRLGLSYDKADEIITGLQDNGSKIFSEGIWTDVKGGDGMECIIDFTDNNVQYASYANGQITRTLDHWVNDMLDIEPKDDQGSLEGAWITPYIMHPDNSILYAGYQDIYRTTTRGNDWTKIGSIHSPDNFRSLAICEYASNTMYAADQTQLWKSDDGGITWASKSANLPTGNNAYILSIAVKPDNPNLLWITLSGYLHDGVYQSDNGGETWTSISAGLPQIPIYSIVYNKLEKSKNDLYVGTELGVYYKDGNNNWIRYSNGLPNVIVDELEIYYNKDNPNQSKLYAATYGRGLWETILNSSGNYVPGITQVVVSDLTSNSATFSANIENDYGNTIFESGFLVNNSTYPVFGSQGTNAVQTNPLVIDGSFSLAISDISFPVYVRPYAKNGNGIGYGKAKAYDKNGILLNTEEIGENSIKVYPNPASGEVYIKTDDLKKGMNLLVIDMTGKTVISKKIESKNTRLPVNHLSKGLYLFKITWKEGETTTKILIK
jgi:photosystem II stability/assembly factor-like uncharacterized protein